MRAAPGEIADNGLIG